MNLQFHLLSRITVAALMCLLATATYVLYHSDRQARRAAHITAESLGKQLEIQLFRINAGAGQVNQFPDFDVWKQTGSAHGICVRFVSTDGAGIRDTAAAGRSAANGGHCANPQHQPENRLQLPLPDQAQTRCCQRHRGNQNGD
jgi:two-component system, NarL family, sensor histidine kinase UhpB